MPTPQAPDGDAPRRRIIQTLGGALAAGVAGLAAAAEAAAPATGAAITRGDLADTDNPEMADALIGVKSPLRDAVRRTQHSKNADFVSAFDFMTQDKIEAVVARREVDVTAELQAAVSASAFVWLPDGTYRISKKLTLRPDSCLTGQSQRGSVLVGGSGSVMLEFPYMNMDCSVRNLSFSGAGATAMAVAGTDGPFKSYLIRAVIEDCHFHWELAYGINANLIYARIHRCSFAYYGEGKKSYGQVAIRSFNSGGNYTNLNDVRNCLFFCGTEERPACDLNGGLGWSFHQCDWSHAGMAVRANNIQVLGFDSCWFEGSTCRNAVVQILASQNVVEFNRCIFQNNNAPRLVQWSSKAVRGLAISNCNMALGANSAPAYDDSTNSYRLSGNGALIWRDNAVSGGRPDNTLLTSVDSSGPGQARGWAIVSGTGAVVASSDPGLHVSRTGVGDLTLGLSNPGASSAATLCVIGTGRTSTVRAQAQDNAMTLRVRCVDPTGKPVDDTVNLVWFGN